MALVVGLTTTVMVLPPDVVTLRLDVVREGAAVIECVEEVEADVVEDTVEVADVLDTEVDDKDDLSSAKINEEE